LRVFAGDFLANGSINRPQQHDQARDAGIRRRGRPLLVSADVKAEALPRMSALHLKLGDHTPIKRCTAARADIDLNQQSSRRWVY
jgi:hypothetical protein